MVEFKKVILCLSLCVGILIDIISRIAQIYGRIAEGHPMSKFMWGNTKSLSPEGMDDKQMHKR